jgi:hypothetical protein
MMDASTVDLLAPDVQRPFWRDVSGARTTFADVVSGLDGGPRVKRRSCTPSGSTRSRGPRARRGWRVTTWPPAGWR